MLTSGWPTMRVPESFTRRHQHRVTTPRQGSEPQHPIHTAATASSEWIAARDQYVTHITACKACYAPKSSYCAAGAALRQRYNSTATQPVQ